MIASAATAYAGLVLAYHHLDVIQKSLETARVHLEMIRKRYENGLAVKSDLLRTQVHIAELDQDRIQAESRISMALAALNAAMGAPGDSSWQLTTELVQRRTRPRSRRRMDRAVPVPSTRHAISSASGTDCRR